MCTNICTTFIGDGEGPGKPSYTYRLPGPSPSPMNTKVILPYDTTMSRFKTIIVLADWSETSDLLRDCLPPCTLQV
jgi:hypothetical protein